MKLFMNGYNMKMFTNVIKATFHVDRPRFGGGVDKRIFVHLKMNAIVKPILGGLIKYDSE